MESKEKGVSSASVADSEVAFMALVEIMNDGTLVSGGWDQSDLQIQAMRGGYFGKEVQEVIGGDDAGCLRENRGGLEVEGGGGGAQRKRNHTQQ